MKILHINATDEGGTFNLMLDIHKALIKKKIVTKIYLPQKKKYFPQKKNISNFYFPNNSLFDLHFYIINILKRIIKKYFLKAKPESTVTLSLFDSFGLKNMVDKIKPDIIAAGNIGCITQIANGTDIPIVHTIELIDWFTGGTKPIGLDKL